MSQHATHNSTGYAKADPRAVRRDTCPQWNNKDPEPIRDEGQRQPKKGFRASMGDAVSGRKNDMKEAWHRQGPVTRASASQTANQTGAHGCQLTEPGETPHKDGTKLAPQGECPGRGGGSRTNSAPGNGGHEEPASSRGAHRGWPGRAEVGRGEPLRVSGDKPVCRLQWGLRTPEHLGSRAPRLPGSIPRPEVSHWERWELGKPFISQGFPS